MVVQNNDKENNVQNKCAALAKVLLFLLIRPFFVIVALAV